MDVFGYLIAAAFGGCVGHYIRTLQLRVQSVSLDTRWNQLRSAETEYEQKRLGLAVAIDAFTAQAKDDGEDDNDDEGEEDLKKPTLETRLDRLGIEYSSALTGKQIGKFHEDLLSEHIEDDEDPEDESVSCARCTSADFHSVFGVQSTQIDGFVGIYCFGCGCGKYANHKRHGVEDANNLFILVEAWERMVQPIDTSPPSIPPDAPV